MRDEHKITLRQLVTEAVTAMARSPDNPAEILLAAPKPPENAVGIGDAETLVDAPDRTNAATMLTPLCVDARCVVTSFVRHHATIVERDGETSFTVDERGMPHPAAED